MDNGGGKGDSHQPPHQPIKRFSSLPPSLPQIAEEIAPQLPKELDFVNEAHNAERAAAFFQHRHDVVVRACLLPAVCLGLLGLCWFVRGGLCRVSFFYPICGAKRKR